MIRRYLAVGLLALVSALGLPPEIARAADGAVILMYHRFGEAQFPSTNIRLEQFEEHLAELKSGEYQVLPVPEILQRLRSGEGVPDRTVGITIDDGYLSIFDEAWPRFKKAGFPFTVFIATEPIDQKLRSHMSWDQIRTLKADGVTVGGHTVSHGHMPRATATVNKQEIERSNQRFVAELGTAPTIFAYPFGEASRSLENLVQSAEYTAAFGQHSGVLHRRANQYYLPRFALNERFGTIERFRLVVNALPLPVVDITPADPTIGTNNPPAFGFTVAEPVENLSRLRCFSSNGAKVEMERLPPRRFEIRIAEPFAVGRSRINCTMRTASGRFRWFGMQYFVPN